MKKKKVLAVLVALLLVVGAGVYTYARYTFSRTGSGEVSAAKWTATVKQGGTAVTDNFTLGLTLSASGKTNPMPYIYDGIATLEVATVHVPSPRFQVMSQTNEFSMTGVSIISPVWSIGISV